ncbi:hypothetical protein FQR65_LT11618 [Abscondita terminalis]|nr:hypothetical protein FQR65_LT11618 [Abscondita terminalis]
MNKIFIKINNFFPDQFWAVVTLTMIGKLTVTASYAVVYIFSTEQFPTVIRSAALGLGSMSARIGSISAPHINLTGNIWKPLPLIIFGTLSFVGGCASLTLPETSNQTLPAWMTDVDKMGSVVVEEEQQKLENIC